MLHHSLQSHKYNHNTIRIYPSAEGAIPKAQSTAYHTTIYSVPFFDKRKTTRKVAHQWEENCSQYGQDSHEEKGKTKSLSIPMAQVG